jgi:hypothetical protein
MQVLVINCSAPHYNLGAAKLADWQRDEGHAVTEWQGDPGLFAGGYDRVCLSVIFSWHAPIAARIARRVKGHAEVWCGGPGLFALSRWWQEQTGSDAERGLDWRFERQRGTYGACFASRGCPVGCYFCIVPKVEGKEFTLDWDFRPAPVLCDNNLSALPVEFQDHVIRRYRETETRLLDANSGFEPRTFDEGTYRRWKPVLCGPWRFAFDEMAEAGDVARMARILRVEPGRKKRVYVLIGNEPPEQCIERVRMVLEWGCEPYCQPLLPLSALSRQAVKVAYGWTAAHLRDLARYTNRFLWRSVRLDEYRPRGDEPPPFGTRGLRMAIA